MSHIPNAAMPHAGGTEEPVTDTGSVFFERAGRLAEIARENPKTTAAAGAALIAGALAAASIPFLRARQAKPAKRSSGSTGSKSGGTKSGTAKRKKSPTH